MKKFPEIDLRILISNKIISSPHSQNSTLNNDIKPQRKLAAKLNYLRVK